MGVAQTVQTAGEADWPQPDASCAVLFARDMLEAFASPLLTVLLDIPWVATALSGWPIFGGSECKLIGFHHVVRRTITCEQSVCVVFT